MPVIMGNFSLDRHSPKSELAMIPDSNCVEASDLPKVSHSFLLTTGPASGTLLWRPLVWVPIISSLLPHLTTLLFEKVNNNSEDLF